jgi:hypothetical protein
LRDIGSTTAGSGGAAGPADATAALVAANVGAATGCWMIGGGATGSGDGGGSCRAAGATGWWTIGGGATGAGCGVGGGSCRAAGATGC